MIIYDGNVDLLRAYLQGETGVSGATVDQLRAFLYAETGVSGNTIDQLRAWLTAQGFEGGTDDMLRAWLASQGYTGATIDMINASASDGVLLAAAAYIPLLTSLGTGSTFVGGGQTVEQYDGSLVTVDADVSAHSGTRLTYDPDEGAIVDTPLVSDDMATDNTTNWLVLDATVVFDTDHYVVERTASTQYLYQPAEIKKGHKYGYEYVISNGTASSVDVLLRTGSPNVYTLVETVDSGTTTADLTTVSGSFFASGDADFVTLYTNMAAGNVNIHGFVFEEIIPVFLNTDPNSYLCHPVDSNGPSLTLDPRGDSTPYDIGDKAYSGRFALTCTAGGTSHTSAPAITSTDLGSTVVDGGVTWSVDSWYQVSRGYLGEEARTNYFINNDAPVTQQVTLGTGDFTVSVLGGGTATSAAVTATGTGFGTASEGTDNTFNLSVGGTVSITIAGGPPDRVDVQNGAFSTSSILTAGATVTRPKTVASLPTANVLPVNNFGARITVEPHAAGLTGWAFNSYTDADNELGVLVEPTAVTLRKRIGGVDYDSAVSYTHAADTQMEVDLYLTASEMGCRVREIGGAWSAWTTTANGADAVIADTYQIGSRNDLVHLNGHFRDVQIYKTSDPKTKLESI